MTKRPCPIDNVAAWRQKRWRLFVKVFLFDVVVLPAFFFLLHVEDLLGDRGVHVYCAMFGLVGVGWHWSAYRIVERTVSVDESTHKRETQEVPAPWLWIPAAGVHVVCTGAWWLLLARPWG